jgi:valyl-tRNA synthetase
MDRYDCRKKIIEDLEAEGLLVKIVDHNHSVGHCYRCQTSIEPTVSKQWFVKVEPLAKAAMEAVRRGDTKIVPAQWEKTYFEWMENIKDWCISRQIWWGHRIPAWTCVCGEVIVAKDDPDSCPKCGSKELSQESDVLDTWFSSALWPFSTMGWPDKTKELKLFYPTSLLVTGFDILFFWVARMMMMGLKFMGEVPFKEVYIHALVRDSEGNKMSKSRGNVIDPLVVIDQYGTDAFRFTLAAFAAQGRDIKMSEDRVDGYRNFVNKIWNASRFALMNLEDFETREPLPPVEELQLADRWILSRLNSTVREVTASLETYRFNEAANSLYQFVWHELCDWYIEMVKPVLYGDKEDVARANTQAVLVELLQSTCKLLHPFMPFLTEELFGYLPGTSGSIMKSDFPKEDPSLVDAKVDADMELVMGVIRAVRNIKGEMGISPSKEVELIYRGDLEKCRPVLTENARLIEVLARLSAYSFTDGEAPEGAATAVVGDLEIYVPLKGNVDFDEEEKRLSKEIAKVEKDLIFLKKKLANKDFIARAPEAVVAKDRKKAEELESKKSTLEEGLERMKCLK